MNITKVKAPQSAIIEDTERKQMDQDPLAKLNKSQTSRLDNFFAITAEEDDELYSSVKRDPQYQAVERFLGFA